MGELPYTRVHISSLKLISVYMPMSAHVGLGKPWPLASGLNSSGTLMGSSVSITSYQ